jgi:pyrimidine oxygenase
VCATLISSGSYEAPIGLPPRGRRDEDPREARAAATPAARSFSNAEATVLHMKFGVFLPSGNGGFAISTTAPRNEPTYEFLRDLTVLAEDLDFGFAMSMIKYRGFGGPTRFWDDALDSLTLTAALAAETKTIELIGTVAMLAVHPAIAARQAMTVSDIAGGRFSLNVVTGWSSSEYEQYDMWPGDSYFRERYDYATEYVKIMQELWATGRSSFSGKYFTVKDAQCGPTPAGGRVPLVCAGRSEKGLRFTADYGDWSFVNGSPDKLVESKASLDAAAKDSGRHVKTLPTLYAIMGATDAEAQERYQHIVDGADREAIEHMQRDMGANVVSGGTGGTAASALQEKSAVFVGTTPVVGSYESLAKTLRQLADQGVNDGVMFQFADYERDMRDFAEHVMPRV